MKLPPEGIPTQPLLPKFRSALTRKGVLMHKQTCTDISTSMHPPPTTGMLHRVTVWACTSHQHDHVPTVQVWVQIKPTDPPGCFSWGSTGHEATWTVLGGLFWAGQPTRAPDRDLGAHPH